MVIYRLSHSLLRCAATILVYLFLVLFFVSRILSFQIFFNSIIVFFPLIIQSFLLFLICFFISNLITFHTLSLISNLPPLSHLISRLFLSPRVISSLVSSHLVLLYYLVRSLLLVLCRPVVTSCITSYLFNLILYHRLPPRLVLSQTSSLGFVSFSTSSLSFRIPFSSTSSRLVSNLPTSRFLSVFGFIFFISHPIFFTSSRLVSRRLSVLLALHHSVCLLIASRHGEEPLTFTPDLHRS